MANYIQVKPSQIHLFQSVPFYYEAREQNFSLYKKEGDRLQWDRAQSTKHPVLYIDSQDRDAAMKELGKRLNMDLIRSIGKGGLMGVKKALCRIVEEALTPDQEAMMDCLPQTLDILLNQYGKAPGAMEYLVNLAASSKLLVDHTVNVAALTLQYCLFHKMPDTDTLRLGLAALVHDVGFARLDTALVETRDRLTEKEYEIYQSHTFMGKDMLEDNENFGLSIAHVALEHHERLDGSGYPDGRSDIAVDSQLIGLIDSYESLTYRDKNFRKAQKPFSSLSLIKEDVIAGRYDKELFKRFTSCLVK